MARIRSIKPKFWDDQKIAKLSFEARLTFIGFWNFADDNGVIIGENGWLNSKIYPHDNIKIKKFHAWVNELLSHQLIIPVIYSGGFYYLLPNFSKHQIINKPNYDDVFIPYDALNVLLKISVNEHGFITDDSVSYNIYIGKEGKGKEGIGGAAAQKKPLGLKVAHLFSDSEFFDFEKFEKEFKGTQYEIFNLKFYHENVANWSKGANAKKIDWISTARNFMLKDAKEHKAVMANENLLINGKQGTTKSNIQRDYSSLEERLEGTIRGNQD